MGLKRGRILKPFKNKRGYLILALSKNGNLRTRAVHKLVALAFIGEPFGNQVVRHLDGDSENNHFTNLKYGTHSENSKDAVRHGTHVSSRKSHCPEGHPYEGENLVIISGRRCCRECRRLANQRRKSSGLDEGDHRHGTLNGYGRGCRCDECRAANSQYMKEYKEKRKNK